MPGILDTVLLLALPASGKSEVRRYLELVDPERRRRDLHLGTQVQLDDFPYVHLMRVVSRSLQARGNAPVFFESDHGSLAEPRDWGTLIELVNEDYQALLERRRIDRLDAGQWLLDRFEAARTKTGIPPELSRLPLAVRAAIAGDLESEAGDLMREHNDRVASPEKDRTVVIEFARGGREGARMPLSAPFGYQYSLGRLSPVILQRAAILYVWVTPEESRRKNQERANPKDPGSILHHGVPETVMRDDYGCDDMDWLETHSDQKGTLRVEAHGRVWHLPIARFDNRTDRTSFLRGDPGDWPASSVEPLHASLATALGRLASAASH